MSRVALTYRDLTLFEALLSFRFLRRDQIQKIVFDGVSTSTTNRRLKMLTEEQFLKRERPPKVLGEGTSQNYYYLTKRSGQALVDAGKIDQVIISQHLRRDQRAKYDLREHNLEINDFHVLVSQAARNHGWKIERWIRDFELRNQNIKVEILKNLRQFTNQDQLPLRPDAFFTVARADLQTQKIRRSHYFLELDRSTEVHAGKIQPKIIGYLSHYFNGQYFQMFGTKSLRVLFVTKTSVRLRNLIQTTQQVQGGNLFWFATLKELKPDNVFDEPVWYPAHQDQPQGLFDL